METAKRPAPHARGAGFLNFLRGMETDVGQSASGRVLMLPKLP